MKPVPTALCAALAGMATLVPAAALAHNGGKLKTMPHGVYECASPGDATGVAWTSLEGESFTLGSASSYTSANGRGTYLLTGSDFVFTRGPKKGERFVRVGDNQLRKLDENGGETAVLCVRARLAG